MKKSLFVLAVFGLLATSCDKKGPGGSANFKLDSDKNKVSYAIGQQIGRGLKAQGVEVDINVLGGSIQDVLDGKDSRMSEDEMRQAMQSMRQKMREKENKEADDNLKKAKSFLAENKKKDTIKETDSGLQYEVMTAGNGQKPKDSDKVKVHYKGTLLDGSEFDSSYKRNRPAEFRVTGVIKGWTEALQMMPKGAKWKLFIPPDLAYGPRGRPGIPPNSLLTFEVELLDIVASNDAGEAAAPKARPRKRDK